MKLIFAFLLLFGSGTAICQQKEYLVKISGDTIWGNIKLKNKVFYVTAQSSLEIKAGDVSKIRSNNYKGSAVFSGDLLTYSDNLYDLEIDYIKKGVTDTVLILEEIYATPKINLYYGIDDFKLPFYFYKTPSDQKPVQLVVHYYLEGGRGNYSRDPGKYPVNKGAIVIAEDKGYVNQLHAIMGDCKNISQGMWELLSYRGYSFKQIIKKYNTCN
jgi:hypothetical protein